MYLGCALTVRSIFAKIFPYTVLKMCSCELISLYVTGFMKTGPNRTRTEIHFIA